MGSKVSNVPYQKLESAYNILKKVKKKLEQAKIENIAKLKKDVISLPNFQDVQNKMMGTKWYNYKIKVTEFGDILSTGLWMLATVGFIDGSTTHIWELKEQPYQINSDDKILATNQETGDEKVSKMTYSLPTYKTAARQVGLPDVPFKFNEDNIDKVIKELQKGKIKYFDLVDECENLNKVIDDLLDTINAKMGNLITIGEAYKDLEKSAKNQFTNKNGQKYSKTQIAKKYGALVTAVGSQKVASKYLGQILKDTKSKVSQSQVVSIYKEWKNNKKKTSGSVAVTEDTATKGSSNSKGAKAKAVATGATVVSATTSKSSKKSSKKKSSKTKNVLTGASVIAATRAGIKSDIKDVKEYAKTQIANAKTLAADKKRKLEIEKNEKIAEINRKAAAEINEIDISDPEAQEKIDAIKARAEEEVDKINEQYNTDIANIDEELAKEINQIENKKAQDVAALNKQLKELKKENKSEVVVQNRLSSKAKAAGVAAVAATTSESDVAASNEEMMNATGELSDAHVAKTYHIEENANNVNNNTQQVPDTTVDNSNASAKVEIEESVATEVETPSETPTPTVENTSNTYTEASHNSGEEYISSNEVSEDIKPEVKVEDSKDTGIDQSNRISDIDESLKESSSTKIDREDDVVSIESSDKKESSKKSSSGLATAIPIGLGVAATGAAAVAGIRYVKNRKQNEDMDLEYDDENNNFADAIDESSNDYIPSDSAYMRDDYLGPEGSSYQEVPDENSYTDTEYLEEEAGIEHFSEDTALNDIN